MRLEVTSTVLLSLTAVAITWSSYQKTHWNGEQAQQSSRTNAIRIDAARSQGRAEAEQVDVATFAQWVDAYAREEWSSRSFTCDDFDRSSDQPFDAWIATRPLTNPDAPLTPFAIPECKLAAPADVNSSTSPQRAPRPRYITTSSARRTTCLRSCSSRCRCSWSVSAPRSMPIDCS